MHLVGCEDNTSKDISAYIHEYEDKICELTDSFVSLFDSKPEEYYISPGRSELIGNHTDHQNGRSIVCAVNMITIGAVRARRDNVIKAVSRGFGSFEVDLSFTKPIQNENGTSESIIRGIANGFIKRGYNIGGFDAFIMSDIKPGSGLSSSAAFEMLIVSIFDGLFNSGKLDATEAAKIAQDAENTYFVKPCGLMDMLACRLGSTTYMDFYDADDPVCINIDTDFASFGYSLVITNVHASHEGQNAQYASIREEMELIASYYNKSSLAYVNEESFFTDINQLREAYSDRAVLRAIHFFDETKRVKEAKEALDRGDIKSFLKLVAQSGLSSEAYLQNVYSCSDEHNRQLSLALCLSRRFLKDKGSVRVHGGGFGGTILAFVLKDMTKAYIEEMDKAFGDDSAYKLSVVPFGSGRIK